MHKDKKIISITLARGGSKGIPRKNLVNICGNPLLYYVLNSAKNSKFIEQVWVSTEDEEIKNYALSQGASVSDRKPELAQDSSKCEDVLKEFTKNVEYDILCFIQTTSPLVLSEDIDRAISLVLSGEYDSVVATTVETWVPRWRKEGDSIVPHEWDPTNRPRRQEMPELLIENGSFYITTREQFLNSGVRYGGNIGYVTLPLERSFQIDTDEELELISKLLRKG